MIIQSHPHSPHDPTGMPIEVSGERWMAQAVFWARAVAGVSLLAGGAVLLTTDWNVVGLPPEVELAIVWSGPAVIYFVMSFFLRRGKGEVLRAVALIAAAHAAAILISAMLVGSSDVRSLYLILGGALVAGLGNLVASAYWARRFMRESAFITDGRRGFAVLRPSPVQSSDSDLGK